MAEDYKVEFCPQCGTQKKPCFQWLYCPKDCDKPKADRPAGASDTHPDPSNGNADDDFDDFWLEADTATMCSHCAGTNIRYVGNTAYCDDCSQWWTITP